MNMKLIVFFAVIAVVYSAPAEVEQKDESLDAVAVEAEANDQNRDKRTLLVSSVVPTVSTVVPAPIVAAPVARFAPIAHPIAPVVRGVYSGLPATETYLRGVNPYVSLRYAAPYAAQPLAYSNLAYSGLTYPYNYPSLSRSLIL